MSTEDATVAKMEEKSVVNVERENLRGKTKATATSNEEIDETRYKVTDEKTRKNT